MLHGLLYVELKSDEYILKLNVIVNDSVLCFV